MIFRDMQNGPQYISMNTKLKENNKKRKITQKNAKNKITKVKNKGKRILDTKRKSKFANKYNERIKSIQESEEQRQKRLKSLNK